jgi:hypothetical protein
MSNYKLHTTEFDSQLFTDFQNQLYDKAELNAVTKPVQENLIGCYVLSHNDRSVGRFALYHNPEISLVDGEKTILIGSFECLDDDTVAKELLKHATAQAKSFGGKQLIGPMEGASWQNYRFTTDDSAASFFTEYKHKTYYPNQFLNNGFKVLRTYSSTIDNNITADAKRLLKFEQKFKAEQLTIRYINLNDFENELIRIGEFSNVTFNKNYLFSEINIKDFVSNYKKLQPLIVPELFFIVENQLGELQAFLFSLPNYLDDAKSSIIVKSMASLPKRNLAGLQIYLGELLYANAIKLRFSKAIHAYMIDDNMSNGLSKKFNANYYKSHHLYQIKL